LFLVVVVLLALAVLAVQMVLRTDLPRRMVLDELASATGLEVEAASLATGWSGHSTLRDVTFRLPLDGSPILTAPTVRVRHNRLVSLLRFPLPKKRQHRFGYGS
jgi:uncharacterized protein YhdP